MSLSKGIQSAAAAALSAAMLIAVAACGTTDGTDTASKSGDSSKDSSSTSIQGFDTSSIQKDDEIAALLPDSVAGDGTLTVGADTSYAPAEFLAEDGKTPVGFDVDLSKALAAVFGLKENTVSSTFDSIIPSVGSKYDIGISSFTVTKER
ncbi:transporter substrate-binding domain-containing protein, partial [Bifidobacterium longum]